MYFLVRTEISVQGEEGVISNRTVHTGPVLLDCLERVATRIAINVEANLKPPTDDHFEAAKATIWIAAWTSYAAYKSGGEPLFSSNHPMMSPESGAPGSGSCSPELTSAGGINGTPRK